LIILPKIILGLIGIFWFLLIHSSKRYEINLGLNEGLVKFFQHFFRNLKNNSFRKFSFLKRFVSKLELSVNFLFYNIDDNKTGKDQKKVMMEVSRRLLPRFQSSNSIVLREGVFDRVCFKSRSPSSVIFAHLLS